MSARKGSQIDLRLLDVSVEMMPKFSAAGSSARAPKASGEIVASAARPAARNCLRRIVMLPVRENSGVGERRAQAGRHGIGLARRAAVPIELGAVDLAQQRGGQRGARTVIDDTAGLE